MVLTNLNLSFFRPNFLKETKLKEVFLWNLPSDVEVKKAPTVSMAIFVLLARKS
jgi:hypothetical protein